MSFGEWLRCKLGRHQPMRIRAKSLVDMPIAREIALLVQEIPEPCDWEQITVYVCRRCGALYTRRAGDVSENERKRLGL